MNPKQASGLTQCSRRLPAKCTKQLCTPATLSVPQPDRLLHTSPSTTHSLPATVRCGWSPSSRDCGSSWLCMRTARCLWPSVSSICALQTQDPNWLAASTRSELLLARAHQQPCCAGYMEPRAALHQQPTWWQQFQHLQVSVNFSQLPGPRQYSTVEAEACERREAPYGAQHDTPWLPFCVPLERQVSQGAGTAVGQPAQGSGVEARMLMSVEWDVLQAVLTLHFLQDQLLQTRQAQCSREHRLPGLLWDVAPLQVQVL